MQRVSAFLPSWEKRNSGPKSAGLFGWGNRGSTASGSASTADPRPPKLPPRINVAAANGLRLQREAFWPATLDLECEKAARILKSFCADGYVVPADEQAGTATASAETSKPAATVNAPNKIPKGIIQNAAGIAVFTCMRSGLWMTGSGGSGILIARKSGGTWSPPSGILLHTPTLSFIIGVDIYDCVLVINNLAALESITQPRVTLGEDVSLTNGPSVPLDSDELHISCKELGNTVLSYVKARGQHQAVNLHGCILTERGNENERFYGGLVTQSNILAGNVSRHVDETRPLREVIKMAEGRTDYDAATIDKTTLQPAPGDAVIATPKSISASPRPAFGIPNAGDPDPFGVLALEMAGLEIREAGTGLRPTSSQLDFHPLPISPSFSKLVNRQSGEAFVSRSDRASVLSSRTVKSQVTDAGTQTDVPNTPETSPSPGQSDGALGKRSLEAALSPSDHAKQVDYTKIDYAPLRHLSEEYSIGAVLAADAARTPNQSAEATGPVPDERGSPEASYALAATSKNPSNGEVKKRSGRQGEAIDEVDDERDQDGDDADDEDNLEDDAEEPVIFEVAAVQPTRTQAIASRVIQARGNVVTIPKRVPPPLPKRSPARMPTPKSTKSETEIDASTLLSPLRQATAESDARTDDETEYVSSQETPAEAKLHESNDDGEAHPGDGATAMRHHNTRSIDEQTINKKEAVEVRSSRPSSGATTGVPSPQPKAETQFPSPRHPATRPAWRTSEYKEHRPAGLANGHRQDDESESSTSEAARPSMDNGESPVDSPNDSGEAMETSSRGKHTSSIYTGATEDRWSCDGSSLTTPTSERPHSPAALSTEEEAVGRPADRDGTRAGLGDDHASQRKGPHAVLAV